MAKLPAVVGFHGRALDSLPRQRPALLFGCWLGHITSRIIIQAIKLKLASAIAALAVGFRMAPMVFRASMSRAAYVLTCIVLYSAIMLALAWGLWQVLPDAIGWLDGTIGSVASGALIFGLIPLAYLVAYLAGRRDSGSAREP
ncbi:hypothetical protein [Bosea beijingensis]